METEGRWAELVTDGHVRAARLRWMQPWLIAIGIGCMLLGFYIGSLTTTLSAKMALDAGSGSTTLTGKVDDARVRVTAATETLPSLSMTTEEVKALPAAKAISTDVIPAVRAALTNGTLPKDIPTVSLSPEAFWQEKWPGAKIVMAGDDTVKVVGALVAEGSEYYAVPRRWIGVFRKKAGQWQYATAEGPGLIVISGLASVQLTDIPLTLAPTLPDLKTDATSRQLNAAGKQLEKMN